MSQREYKHPLREYECRECEFYFAKETAMDEPAEFTTIQFCPTCKRDTTYDRVFSPSYLTAGIYTKRYTGQEAAVSGWGTYNLDYGKSGSDLLAGRAKEVAEANPVKVRNT